MEQQLVDPIICDNSEKICLKQVQKRKVEVNKLLEEAERVWMAAEKQVTNIG